MLFMREYYSVSIVHAMNELWWKDLCTLLVEILLVEDMWKEDDENVMKHDMHNWNTVILTNFPFHGARIYSENHLLSLDCIVNLVKILLIQSFTVTLLKSKLKFTWDTCNMERILTTNACFQCICWEHNMFCLYYIKCTKVNYVINWL